VKTSKFATTLRPALAILALTSATEVYKKGTQMKNQKRTFSSHGNLHFTGSWRLGKLNETQRKYNVFILDELINNTFVSSINDHYIDKKTNLFTSEAMCAICLTNTNESNVFF
jgi:hypothetical protein